MATKTVKVTLTEKNDAGPLFDLFYSVNNGLSYTSSIDSSNLYLPFVGASAVANVDDLSNAYQLKSKGACINSVNDNLPTPTPTPTATPCVTGLIKYTVGSGSNSEACALLNLTDIWRTGVWNAFSQLYIDANGCTLAPAGYYSDGTTLINWSGSNIISIGSCSIVPTPGPTPVPTSTPGPTATPTPTPTPSFTSFGYHSITKSLPNQFKSVWSSSSQAYQAYALIQYLTGQSSPTQNTPYVITAPSVKIWDSLGTERVDINSTGSSTVLWFYDGVQVVVEWNNVSPAGTYADGGTYFDTWGYQKD